MADIGPTPRRKSYLNCMFRPSFVFLLCMNVTFDSGNYLHSPETWAQMWRKAFTEVESAEFAETKLEFKADFLSAYGKAGIKGMDEDLPEMFWSIKLV